MGQQGQGFGTVADAYERGRPGYGRDAVAWLTADDPMTPLTVLELGAGTGKLTEQLVALGHVVHATDVDRDMLDVLAAKLPHVRTSVAKAEDLPAASQAYDVVIAAQCFHWFDAERVLAEAARVLKPGGTVALLWHTRDESVPWVRRLGRILGSQEHHADPAAALSASDLFDVVEEQVFGHWQVVDRRSITDLLLSRSNVIALDDAERERLVAELVAFYDEYGRGMDGMQLPYRTLCFRATVRPQAVEPVIVDTPSADQSDVVTEPTVPLAAADLPRRRPLGDSAADLPRVVVPDPDDDAVLLINLS